MDNKTMSEKIKQLRMEHGLTLEQVANKVGVGKSTVRKWETGIIANMKRDKIAALAEALYTTPAYLMGWEESEPQAEQNDLFTQLGIMPISKKKLPILGNAACGEPKYAEQTFEGYVTVGADMQADFCLYAKGDSMVNARIHDGDIVFVRKQDIVEDGEIAVVLVEDDTTIKRVYYDRENNILTLVPENPAFKVMRYVGAELNQIRILGKVIAGQYNVG
jgi:repressor LexA